MSEMQRRLSGHLRPLVSVLTPSVPERAAMLEEACASVDAQTLRRWEHLVDVDTGYTGCARTVNRLAAAATAEWLLILADDDLLKPDCLARHFRASKEADIVYGPPTVEGEDASTFHGDPPAIPSLCLIRRHIWEDLGGYQEDLTQREDRNLYERALERGIRFVRIPQETWVYRFHGVNKSRGGGFGPAIHS